MDERQRRAWAVLDVGPQWVSRVEVSTAPAPAGLDSRPACALNWDELQSAVSSCTACGLAAGRTQTVFGAGSIQSPWMLVGEAPGEQEDASGEPFVGAAGQLLDQMMAAVGIDRSRKAFITNVLKCRLPRDRDPQPDEIAGCLPFFHAQVTQVNPQVIVALGRLAAQALLGSESNLSALRGRVHRYRCGDRDIPLVVTLHPADLLRSLPDKAKAWADLCLARRCLDQQTRD